MSLETLGIVKEGMYKVPKFNKYFWEEFKVVKRGREFRGVWEEYQVEQRERVSNIICSIILRLYGRLSSGEEEKGTKIFGKKIKSLKNGGGEEYHCRELYTPLSKRFPRTGILFTTFISEVK